MYDSIPMEPWQIREARLRQLRDGFTSQETRDFLTDVEIEMRTHERNKRKIERLQRELAEARRALDDAGLAETARAEKAERERDEALAAIRNAPHTRECAFFMSRAAPEDAPAVECTCWKRAALDGYG